MNDSRMEVEPPSTDTSYDGPDLGQNYGFENFGSPGGHNSSGQISGHNMSSDTNMIHRLAQEQSTGWNMSNSSPGQQPMGDQEFQQVAAYASRQGFRMDQFGSNCSHSLPHNFRSNMMGSQHSHSQGLI